MIALAGEMFLSGENYTCTPLGFLIFDQMGVQ